MPEAIIHIAPSYVALPIALPERDVVLMPASGSIDDPVAREVAEARLHEGRSSRICVPSWRSRFQDGIDRRLLEAAARVAVVDLDTARPGGPFVLDLPSHYCSPLRRARLLASPERGGRVVALHRDVPVAAAVFRAGHGIWLGTTDMIAAELVALALVTWAEGPPGDRQTPWEDELVQRATEIDLGARVPTEIRVSVAPECHLRSIERLLTALHLRTGVDISFI